MVSHGEYVDRTGERTDGRQQTVTVRFLLDTASAEPHTQTGSVLCNMLGGPSRFLLTEMSTPRLMYIALYKLRLYFTLLQLRRLDVL